MRSLLGRPVAGSIRDEPWEKVSPTATVKKDAVRLLLHDVRTIRVGVECAQGRGSVSASMAALNELMRQARGGTRFQVVFERGAENGLAAVVTTRGKRSAILFSQAGRRIRRCGSISIKSMTTPAT